MPVTDAVVALPAHTKGNGIKKHCLPLHCAVRRLCPRRRSLMRIKAKFHYTGPTGTTGPARTRTDFFAARVSEKLRWVRAGLRQSPCRSVPVRSGPVGPVQWNLAFRHRSSVFAAFTRHSRHLQASFAMCADLSNYCLFFCLKC